MRMQPEKIRLGAKEWVIRPLTLGQVQEIEPVLVDGSLGSKGNVGAALAIVAIAIRRDDPEAASNLCDIEATVPEIGAAMCTVLRLGGFIQPETPGVSASGEAQAGVAIPDEGSGSNSEMFTPA